MMNFKNLLIGKKAVAKNVIVLTLLILIGLTFLVVAQTQEELQQELDQLETELSDAGYNEQEKTMFAGEVDKELNLNVNNLFIYINLEFNYEIE